MDKDEVFARWQVLRDRIRGATVAEVMDTPAKAEAEGVPLGTIVLRQSPPTSFASMEDSLEFAMLDDAIRRRDYPVCE